MPTTPARPPSATAAARPSGSRGGSAACSTRARNSFGTTSAGGTGEPALRAVRPGDITLLFRALTNVEYYEEALRRYGIDYYLVGGHAFYAQQEIYDIVNLLRRWPVPAMKSAWPGSSAVPCSGCWTKRSTGFPSTTAGFPAVSGAVVGMADSDRQVPRLRNLLRRGTDPRPLCGGNAGANCGRMKDRMPIAQLLHQALERTGYDALLLAEFLGERKLANLHKLIEQARQFDAAGIFTLADFITQLAQFVARQPDEPLAATQPESINAVRLMSIHQSKGLEFPVVVVVDVDRPRRGPTDAVAFTPQLGPMVRFSGCTSGLTCSCRPSSTRRWPN